MDAFLARLTPAQYDEWATSFAIDPPLETLVKTLNGLVAQLLASYHTVHGDPDAAPQQAADYLPVYDAEPDAPDDADTAESVSPHPMGMRSGLGVTTTVAGVRGTGAVVPDAVFGVFQAGEDEGEAGG